MSRSLRGAATPAGEGGYLDDLSPSPGTGSLLADRSGAGRDPGREERVTLPGGRELTLRAVDTVGIGAARDLHDRCSEATLRMRYHGPPGEADRYLAHLLSPRFGHTVAAEATGGLLVGLGHLLWDGDETEVALLVEDSWQRRGVGGRLLRRLVSLAHRARAKHVYAVTQPSNTGMIATMRGLGVPLDRSLDDGVLVLSVQPDRSASRGEAGGSDYGPSPG